jgi:hypothetical protein
LAVPEHLISGTRKGSQSGLKFQEQEKFRSFNLRGNFETTNRQEKRKKKEERKEAIERKK